MWPRTLGLALMLARAHAQESTTTASNYTQEYYTHTQDCPPSFERHNESCYLFVDSPTSQPDAAMFCEERNAQLACPTNAEEAAWLGRQAANRSQDYWMSINDIDTEGFWHMPCVIDGDWAFPWCAAEPNDAGSIFTDFESADCVRIIGKASPSNAGCTPGLWADYDCRAYTTVGPAQSVYDPIGFICQTRSAPPPAAPRPPSSPPSGESSDGCPPQFVSHGGSCYLFVDTPTSRSAAVGLCEEQGAHLACPTSEEESAWLGGRVAERGQDYWLSMTDVEEEDSWYFPCTGAACLNEDDGVGPWSPIEAGWGEASCARRHQVGSPHPRPAHHGHDALLRQGSE